jgi:opacity protein-like surface antigen
MKSLFVFLALALTLPLQSKALFVELGFNYAYKKSTYDGLNNTEQQSTTGSLSFYAWEQLGIELSYTNGLYVQKAKSYGSSVALQRTTTQFSDIYGADLIYLITGKQSKFQPYIKGGAAYIRKKQVVQDDGQPANEAVPPAGVAPSYGVGLKFFITESLAIRAGYDVLRTPIDDNSKVDDITGRLGLSWIL